MTSPLTSTPSQAASAADFLNSRQRYLAAVAGERLDRPPVWIMRQAGRYMPEYRAIRARHSFDEMCRLPEVSAEASLLPLHILGVDALIVFNDILVPLGDMGLEVTFDEQGPLIGRALRHADNLECLRRVDYADGAAPPVVDSLRLIRQEAGDQHALLGFAGAPFTMAAYAVEGRLSRSLDHVKRMRFECPAMLRSILERITETVASYLISQIQEGGADAVQLFDTWAGQLSPSCFEEFAWPFQCRVIELVKAACPGVPVTLFMRGGESVMHLLSATGADVLSLDWRTSLSRARAELGGRAAPALQGNLDPLALFSPQGEVARHFQRTLEGFDPFVGYIANLGHGILPGTPVACAQAFVQAVHALRPSPTPCEVSSS